jgi:hypothetical protein
MARPQKARDDRRDRKIIIWVSDREHARYLINAARAHQTGPEFARTLLCGEAPRVASDHRHRANEREFAFATLDALNRLGANVDHLLRITVKTGHLPDELDDVAAKIDALLDRLLPA